MCGAIVTSVLMLIVFNRLEGKVNAYLVWNQHQQWVEANGFAGPGPGNV